MSCTVAQVMSPCAAHVHENFPARRRRVFRAPPRRFGGMIADNVVHARAIAVRPGCEVAETVSNIHAARDSPRARRRGTCMDASVFSRRFTSRTLHAAPHTEIPP